MKPEVRAARAARRALRKKAAKAVRKWNQQRDFIAHIPKRLEEMGRYTWIDEPGGSAWVRELGRNLGEVSCHTSAGTPDGDKPSSSNA